MCGLEELGLRVVEELDRLGEQVVVLAHEPDPRHRAGRDAPGRDHRRRRTRRTPRRCGRCGIPGARAPSCSRLDGDIANIHGALAARALDPTLHVVMRAFDEEFGRSVESLIPGAVALSASSLAAPGFVSALVDDETDRRLDMLGRDLALRHADPDDPNVLAVLADEGQRPVELFPASSATPSPDDDSDDAAIRRGDCASWMPRATRRAPWRQARRQPRAPDP